MAVLVSEVQIALMRVNVGVEGLVLPRIDPEQETF